MACRHAGNARLLDMLHGVNLKRVLAFGFNDRPTATTMVCRMKSLFVWRQHAARIDTTIPFHVSISIL